MVLTTQYVVCRHLNIVTRNVYFVRDIGTKLLIILPTESARFESLNRTTTNLSLLRRIYIVDLNQDPSQKKACLRQKLAQLNHHVF